MVSALKRNFEHIYSIELSEMLFAQAKEKFKKYSNVTIIHGDSGIQIGNLINFINKPVLFWLDGHYSGDITAKGEKETPIYEELKSILNANNLKYVILIDDARCFGKLPDYPTIQELIDFVKSKRNDLNIAIEDDIIRIVPDS